VLSGVGRIAEETAVVRVVECFLQQRALSGTPCPRDRIIPLMHLLMDAETQPGHVHEALHAFSRPFQGANRDSLGFGATGNGP
jgi:hypothetical protein